MGRLHLATRPSGASRAPTSGVTDLCVRIASLSCTAGSASHGPLAPKTGPWYAQRRMRVFSLSTLRTF